MKKILSVILVIALIALASACGVQKDSDPVDPGEKPANTEPEKPADTEPEPAAPVEVTFHVEPDELPIIDGATAFYPYYKAMVARMIGLDEEETATRILCSTTDYAYPYLADREVDLIFCLLPSEDQVEYAKEAGVEFEYVPFLNEGFVFFVNKDNPVDELTIDQLHDIYAGKITNWKEVGGDDVEITAYQRTEGSGSQTGLYLHVIPQDEVIQPPKEKVIGTMGEIIDAVAGYENKAGAIGYSYNYFVTSMHYDESIKLLKINGIAPSNDSIASGKYPMISQVCAVFRSDEPEGSLVRQIAEWCRSEEGQALAVEKGYVPNKK
jgi:phosphate transport system substrate-binding protein